MRRPRLTLSLFNPRRRLRDRLMVAMLVVALVPGAAFFVLTAVSLHGITQTTANGAYSSIVASLEHSFQVSLGNAARTAIERDLATVRTDINNLAGTLATYKSTPPATLTVDPAVGQVNVVQTAPTQPNQGQTAPAELLVGAAPQGNPAASVESRASKLAGYSAFATQALASAQEKVGSFVDSFWVMDQTNNAVWIAPGGLSLHGGAELDANPQGMPVDLITSVSTTASSPWQWTAPYQNALHGDWEVTVYAPAGSLGYLVGADVPLAQFGSLISEAPTDPGSYPLLLESTATEAVGAGGAGALPEVIAAGATGKDFTKAPQVGVPLPAPNGKGGPAALAALGLAAQTDASGPAPIATTVDGVSRLLFSAPVGEDGLGWVLVDSVPAKDFHPNYQATLQTAINTTLTGIFQSAIPIVAILVLVCFLLATGLSRLIVAPVRALTRSAERLAKGRTDEAVPTQRHDEVGDLADSLERMRQEINASREVILAASRELEQKVAVRTAELSARNEELLALNALAGSLTRSLDPQAILAGALDAVRAVLPTSCDRGYLLARDGHLTAGRPEDDRLPALEAAAAAAVADNHLVTHGDGDGVLIGLPLATGAGPLGALGLRSTVTPGAEMTALLMAIGNQVGLALSTARLSEEGREMAVLEERARLAREIHDTLAQQLAGIVIQLEAAQALVSRDPGRSLPALASAQELARSGLAEARRSVWDLRPAPLTWTGLVAATDQEVERFRRRTGIAAKLRAERMVPPPALRPQAEVTLLRITQQALANIAAHSGASRVSVRLRNLGDHVELTVKDNGHGFDTAALPPGSFGIVGMAERARIAGGTFQVESVNGRGTTITVQLPVTADAGVDEPTPQTAVPA